MDADLVKVNRGGAGAHSGPNRIVFSLPAKKVF